MHNLNAVLIGLGAAVVASVLMYRFVMPMRLEEIRRKAELDGVPVTKEDEERVKKFFRFGVPAAVTASFTISAIYLIGDVQ